MNKCFNNEECHIVIEGFTGFSLRCNVIRPVNFRIIHQFKKETWNPRQWKRIPSTFQQKNFVIVTVGGKTINDNRTRWTTSNCLRTTTKFYWKFVLLKFMVNFRLIIKAIPKLTHNEIVLLVFILVLYIRFYSSISSISFKKIFKKFS